MPFRPAPLSQLIIRNRKFTVCEHPAAKGMAYGQAGRRATVYQLRAEDGRYFALKVFNQTFRTVEIEQSAKNLQNYAALPGLVVCQRAVLNDVQDAALLQQYPDLRYAALMPWVLGRTWQEVILARIDFKPRESYQFANSLVNILAGMERAGLAHCDLSGANVLLPGLFNQQPPVALVDVEEMYLPGAQMPARLPAGTPGYNHPTVASGLWGANVDRFAGAVLIAEMLGWFDPQVRQSALVGTDGRPGEQYFSADEIQKPCPRFDALRCSLETNWSAGVAALLARAWSSATLAECPSFAEWQGAFTALTSRLPVLEEMSLPRSDTRQPLKGWRNLTGGPATADQPVGGRYRILELFSDGGFGAVYLAADLRDNSRCALKKNKDQADESRRQFAREAALLRGLNHPNLVKVLDYLDLQGEGQYIVMELIQGDDLQSLMTRHGAMPLNQALPYIRQICEALGYLHAQIPPIIHRDVKPANIRITADGRAVLMDFGIAKTAAPDVRTTIGARAVSPGFSPPEQYGQNITDARADVYALGATVWSLLVGRPPQESVDRMGRDTMFPLNGALLPAVEQTLQRALDLNPLRRFASAREFWLALEGAARVTPAVAVPPIVYNPLPVSQPKRKPTRKIPVWLFAIVGLLLFACFVAGGLLVLPSILATPVVITAPQKTETIGTTVTAPPVPVTATLTIAVYPKVNPRDEANLSYIPASEFIMGITPQQAALLQAECAGCDMGDALMPFSQPQHTAYVDAFLMYKMEVSNSMYAKCVNAGICAQPSSKGWSTMPNYWGNPQYANYPVNYVNWDQAATYCRWAGGRLPSEAEWEYAARGSDGRLFPWGNNLPNASLANIADYYGDQLLPVDSFPNAASPFGVINMTGNVWEWVNDWYDPQYYSYNTNWNNPIGPEQGTTGANGSVPRKAGRGGNYWTLVGVSSPALRDVEDDRDANKPNNGYPAVGFRCVIDIKDHKTITPASQPHTATPSITVSSTEPPITPTIDIPIPLPTNTPTMSINQARVAFGIDYAALRKSPGYRSKNDDVDVIAKIPPGQTVAILGGPQSADELNWWYASWNGYTGWVADKSSLGETILIFDSPIVLPTFTPSQVVQDNFTQFFTDYFGFLNSKQYKKSYAMLSPNFQKLQSYAEYVDWWSKVKKVEFFSTEVKSQTETQAFVRTETKYYYKSGVVSPAHTTYKLIKDPSRNVWLIEPSSGQ